MLYYRRKILLAMIEEFGGTIEAVRLQKLLFLFTQKQDVKSFDFVPYLYGCFSFQANQDIATLKTYGYLTISNDGTTILLSKSENHLSTLNQRDKQCLAYVKDNFSALSQNALIRYTYIHYPYFATKSTIAKRILSEEEMAKVNAVIKHGAESILFTIGYE